MTTQDLDREPIDRLVREFMLSIRDHYLRRPIDKRSPLEILNALACITAVIIVGARDSGHEGEARDFFALALNQQLSQPIESILEGQSDERTH